MKVLHLINSIDIGGAEMLLANTLTEGGLQDHTENILVYFNGDPTLVPRISSTVKVICLNYSGVTKLPATLRKLKKIILDNKIDIIHSHLNPAGFYVNLIRPKNIQQVHTLHIAYSTDFETKPLKKFLERKFLFDSKDCNLIFLSEFTKKDFLDAVKFKGKTFVLNNFIDDSFFLHPPRNYDGPAKGALRLLAVGNFRQQKNYPYLLEIFKELKEYNIHLDIYGGGETEKYQQSITENKLNVILKGQVDDINAVIGGYDLFIMASTNEGFPLSVFEAMAASVPLMLSDIGPLKNIVKDNAIYFGLGNARAAAQQILAVLQGKTDITAMAAKARQYAEETVRRKSYINRLLGIYQEVIEQSSKS